MKSFCHAIKIDSCTVDTSNRWGNEGDPQGRNGDVEGQRAVGMHVELSYQMAITCPLSSTCTGVENHIPISDVESESSLYRLPAELECAASEIPSSVAVLVVLDITDLWYFNIHELSFNSDLTKDTKKVIPSVVYTEMQESNGESLIQLMSVSNGVKEVDGETSQSPLTVPINSQVIGLEFLLRPLESSNISSFDVVHFSEVSFKLPVTRQYVLPPAATARSLMEDSVNTTAAGPVLSSPLRRHDDTVVVSVKNMLSPLVFMKDIDDANSSGDGSGSTDNDDTFQHVYDISFLESLEASVGNVNDRLRANATGRDNASGWMWLHSVTEHIHTYPSYYEYTVSVGQRSAGHFVHSINEWLYRCTCFVLILCICLCC